MFKSNLEEIVDKFKKKYGKDWLEGMLEEERERVKTEDNRKAREKRRRIREEKQRKGES